MMDVTITIEWDMIQFITIDCTYVCVADQTVYVLSDDIYWQFLYDDYS